MRDSGAAAATLRCWPACGTAAERPLTQARRRRWPVRGAPVACGARWRLATGESEAYATWPGARRRPAMGALAARGTSAAYKGRVCGLRQARWRPARDLQRLGAGDLRWACWRPGACGGTGLGERGEALTKELIVPAVEGTLNVLRAAKEAGGVRRVVVTSSVSAIVPNLGWPAGEVLDERCWTDLDYCEKNGVWYPASKTLAEKAAWKFAEENGLDVVVVNPGTVMGPIIPPGINASMAMFLRLLEGCAEEYKDFFMGPVHVEDVASAHIMLFENPSASGRHICVESICHWSDLASKVAELYPNYKVPKFPRDTQPGLVRAEVGSKKLIELGLQFSPMEKIIKDAVECLKSRGYVA